MKFEVYLGLVASIRGTGERNDNRHHPGAKVCFESLGVAGPKIGLGDLHPFAPMLIRLQVPAEAIGLRNESHWRWRQLA